jgi:hypothetical protein
MPPYVTIIPERLRTVTARESLSRNSILPIQRRQRCNFQPYSTQVKLLENA